MPGLITDKKLSFSFPSNTAPHIASAPCVTVLGIPGYTETVPWAQGAKIIELTLRYPQCLRLEKLKGNLM